MRSHISWSASRSALHLFILSLLAATTACGDIPKDPDDTLERVRTSGELQVGLVARGGERPAAEQIFLRRIAEETGAMPATRTGPADELLSRLEQGQLDLVLGEFHNSSPWIKRVTFVPPLSGKKDDGMAISAATTNGENAWIAFLHRHASPLGGGQ